MAEVYTMIWLMVLLPVIGHCVATTFPPEQHVDENTILDLAEKSNKTFLKLIGLAIQNLRCDFDRCSQWSRWTGDMSYRGQFGVKTRTRDCWYDSCNKTGPKVVENDNVIYEGICPASYNVTGKLCIAYYKDKMNHSAAQELCQKDGGSLITIDTKERYELAQNYTTSYYVHVQGTRRVAGGPFFDDAGNLLEDSRFFKWASGQPDNGARVSLVVVFMVGKEHHDVSEGSAFNVLCEVRQ